ncbi:hypothetical protein [Shimazuella kribbensis]|uniref:hypothetical protein n=1 Tax=Shimazuella kribbensis TaxID=139808 RepID=UPI000427CC68|nr:hypothetical protein [Shimazuella kribbensis]
MDQHVADEVLQAGIDEIDQHASSIEEIETYYWKRSDGRVSIAMYAKCDELGVRLEALRLCPYDAYLACIMKALQS